MAVSVILPNLAHFELMGSGWGFLPSLFTGLGGVCKLGLDGVCTPVRQPVCTHRGAMMPKKRADLTPLERAIQQQTDKHARWAARQREAGFKRITVLVHEDDEARLRSFAAELLAARRGLN